MEHEEFKLEDVWHLISDRHKAVLLTLSEVAVSQRRIMLRRPWTSYSPALQRKIIQVLDVSRTQT